MKVTQTQSDTDKTVINPSLLTLLHAEGKYYTTVGSVVVGVLCTYHVIPNLLLILLLSPLSRTFAATKCYIFNKCTCNIVEKNVLIITIAHES